MCCKSSFFFFNVLTLLRHFSWWTHWENIHKSIYCFHCIGCWRWSVNLSTTFLLLKLFSFSNLILHTPAASSVTVDEKEHLFLVMMKLLAHLPLMRFVIVLSLFTFHLNHKHRTLSTRWHSLQYRFADMRLLQLQQFRHNHKHNRNFKRSWLERLSFFSVIT